MMKISIITPSFNSAKFIEDCIKSVLEQNYHNFEHIIVDGGSTDGTIEILQKYKHLIWISEKDDGQSDALNKGMDLVSGDIIGWLNSDDIYLPNAFARIISIFNNEKYDAVYSNYYFANERLQIIKPFVSHIPIVWLSYFHCFIPSTTFFFSKRIVQSGIKFDVSKRITMDKDFFANILKSGYKLNYYNEYWALFRVHKGNISGRNKDTDKMKFEEGLDIFVKHTKIKIKKNKVWLYFYKLINYSLNIFRYFLRKL